MIENIIFNFSGIILALNTWIFLCAPIFFIKSKHDKLKETISKGTTKSNRLNFIISTFLLSGGLLQIIFSYFLYSNSEQFNFLPFLLFGFLGFLAFIESYFTLKSWPKTHYIIAVSYFILFPISLILMGLNFNNSLVTNIFFCSSFIYCTGALYFLYKKYLGTYLEFFLFGILGAWAIITNLVLL